MRCSDNQQDQINSLAAGELTPIRAWRLRRHLRRCPACAARFEQAQSMLQGLKALSAEPPPDALRQRIFALFPQVPVSAYREPGLHTKETSNMKAIKYGLVFALTAIIVTGAFAARWLFYPSITFSDQAGRHWRITGDFQGETRILNAHDELLGSTVVQKRHPATEEEDITVDDNYFTTLGHFHLKGPGRHELRAANGELLGYAVLSKRSEEEILKRRGWKQQPRNAAEALLWSEKEQQASGASGTDSYPWGFSGFDKSRGWTWKMRGTGKLKVFLPGNARPIYEGETMQATPELLRDLPGEYVEAATRKVPEFEVTIGGHTIQAREYGKHEMRDMATGQIVLIIEASPLGS